MIINDGLLLNSEKIILALRGLYAGYGYAPYRMSKFEEYDLYAKNKEFLVSDSVITFTDADGKLMALKPDVTLSIIKNGKYGENEIKKVYYSENVYRPAGGTDSFKEIMQTGLECFGAITEKEITEVIRLAAKSLKLLSKGCVLDVSDIGVINAVISGFGLSASAKKALYKAIGEKNLHEIDGICSENGVNDKDAAFLAELIKIGGNVKSAAAKLVGLADKCGKTALIGDLKAILKTLSESEEADVIRLDFSVTGDFNYYNGIVFKGFISGVPTAVLSGGQYDNLMRKMRKNSKAIGFAVYTDALDRAEVSDAGAKSAGGTDEYLNIALPKGRLGEKVYALFAKAGYECPSVLEESRKLIFENAEKKVRYFWVKPSDVAIYVERGAADVGVAGKDILLEYRPDVYELLDLKAGKCKMAVAAKNGFKDDKAKTLRVATKFTRIAKEFYMSEGRDIDIIKLNGSIELAPILGLSDVIVDIVETGATLKENDLSVLDTIVPISARLIANKSSSKFKDEAIRKAVEKISAAVNE
ncbi:MAG: ATP phosphoribosyltransferase [Christensenellaceae bacterium]